jgi:hypothetical protein
MKSRSYARLAPDLVLLLIVAWVLAGYIRYAVIAPPTFDGAMNLNTGLSFVEGRGYGFFYNVFFPFPAQTDGPFTLPAGLLMRLGGVTPLTTQGVNLAYLFGAVIVGYLLLRRITRSTTFALVGTVIILATPGMSSFSMGGLGEIPCLFWLLLALLTLAPTLDQPFPSEIRLALGGASLALCLLTKTVALVMVAPTFVLFVAMFVFRHRRDAWPAAWLLVGLVLPVLGWEVFRLLEIGGLPGYLEWWRLQFGQTLLQSGAAETLGASRSPLAKGTEHLRILGGLIGTPVPALAIFLVGPWLVMAVLMVHRWRRGDRGNVFCVMACVAISVLYFFWWLVIEQTEMTWLRRILDGLVIQQILLVISLVALIRMCRPGGKLGLPRRLLASGLLIALLFSGSFLVANGETLTDPPAATAADVDALALAGKLRDLPADATLFGFGWWKNPVLALFSGRAIMNFYYWDPAKINALANKFLVVDFYARNLAQGEVQDILSTASFQVLADRAGGVIYRLEKVRPYRSFTTADREPEKLRTRFLIADGPYAATRGFYPPEGAAAWAKPDAALLLRRTDQTQLSISMYVPPHLTAEDSNKPLRLHVSSTECVDSSVPVEPGLKTVVLPLTCPPSVAPETMEILLDVNGHVPQARQIDADPRRLAYLVTDIRLQGPSYPAAVK